MVLALRNSYTTPANNPSPKQQTGVVVVAGDLIIVGWRTDGQNTPTVTDSASNTYAQVGTGLFDNTPITDMHIFYAIAQSSGTLTITITSATAGYSCVTVHVVSGANQTLANVLDTYDFASRTAATSHTSPSITTTNANDYIFVWYSQDLTNAVVLTETSGGFTKRQETNDYNVGGPSTSFDKIVSATGSYSQTVSVSASAPEVIGIAAFKSAESTPAPGDTGQPNNGSFQLTVNNPTINTSLQFNQKSQNITVDTVYLNHIGLQFGGESAAFVYGSGVVTTHDATQMFFMF